MKVEEINLRDPFVLAYEGVYYLYGTRGYNCWEQPEDLSTLGFDVYTSKDLQNWSDPIEIFRYTDEFWGDQNFWAPEVHHYQGKFYMFASFTAKNKCRGTQILVSNSPLGPFVPHSEESITPKNWECLDGTLYVDEQNIPHLIFCHEWVQIRDGTICSVELSQDLRERVGEVKELFHASTPSWAEKNAQRFVTDGPCVYKASDNSLCLFWSSLKGTEYVEAISFSENGQLDGKWQHAKELFFSSDGGHGMLFKGFDEEMYFTLHQPNEREKEHPVFIKISEEEILSFKKDK
ncbi:Glycosyl hydrolases family 43 [Pilibacter termitis]|uniref:Glycosyl hydrolases family 43 n=1 Tax=Pilibacter termitis TaxID=263852 RepID=A0A1T4KRD9_9ENTE|nr:glycoside hydrolase family 43 protein [Pilibacter termitis]SJZ44897.1 Glycosyl hydrolases family 43 [Pilibacter termitis]